MQIGDSLLLEETPTTLPTGEQIWKLTDKNGFTGTATLASEGVSADTFALIPSEPGDVAVSEVVVIKEVTLDSDPTEIVLVDPLVRSYDRPTVTIYANVAAATHGETRREVLGSGDAARGFQKFTLKQKPLTYVSAPTASGAETTLQVRVNDVLWEEAPSLYNLPARERAYITRLDDDGNVSIAFGDGITGARLPSGDENIAATYRTGIGVAGMVKAGQLSLLMTRPLGVQKVSNPLAPTGAADPESRDQARQNAPFTVLTLDRIVSLRDFEDFARAFAGIGKAQATWLWDGEQRIVHLTIAAATSNGADFTVDPTSALFANLTSAIDAARDTVQRLLIASYEPIFFRLKARILIDPSYIAEKVLAAVTAALQQAYAFEQRSFGQPVHKSEVLAIIQAVEGVNAAFLDQLYLRGKTAELQTPLLASRAVRDETATQQAGRHQTGPTAAAGPERHRCDGGQTVTTYTAERLYELLPAIYRLRDAEQGYPLRSLLSVIAREIGIVEEDIARLYANWFIETSDEWVVPYIGDLLGVRGLHALEDAGFTRRAFVANTLSYRRRKGTPTMLEQLARDTTQWNARVVEFFELLGTTQYLNHLRPHNVRTPDLRQTNALELLDTPFDGIGHTADVRRIAVGPRQAQHPQHRHLPVAAASLLRDAKHAAARSPARRMAAIPSARWATMRRSSTGRRPRRPSRISPARSMCRAGCAVARCTTIWRITGGY